jgi:PAS domain S-box-containing protein
VRGLNLFVFPQMVLTIFLVALLWSLHGRLRRQTFFWWWACAWTAFALFLALASLRMRVPTDWALLRGSLTLPMMLAGFIQSPLLVFGAVSLHSPGRPTRRWVQAGIGLAAAAAVLFFVLSLLWRGQPLGSFSWRNVPRTLALASALLYCAAVFSRRWRISRSWAIGVTAGFCLLYGISQLIYTAALISRWAFSPDAMLRRFLDPAVVVQSPLFLVDLTASCGVCLGMVLLQVEEHQRAERALLQTVSRSREVDERNAALQAEIAERRRVEKALRESEDRYRDLVEHSEDLISTHDLEGRLLWINPAAARILGYRVEELLHMRLPQLLWPEHRREFDDYLQTLQRDGVAKGVMSVQTHGGERRIWEYHSTLRTEGVPAPIVRGVAHDVTDRFRAEKALRESAAARQQAEARHQAILRALPDMIFLLTTDGVFLDYHARDLQHLLVPPESFLGRNISEVLPPDLANGLARCFMQALESNEPSAFEYSVPVNGETRYYEARVVRCDSDKLLSVVRDITERTRAEAEARELRDELAHVGRVTMLGALTGSLAHEINQPLAAIGINAQAALNIVAGPQPASQELREAMNDIIADSQRAGDVLHRLRTLLVKGTTEYTPLEIKAVIDEVLRLVHSEAITRRIVLEVDLERGVPEVLGDRVQLQQVVLNLLINAFEAVRDLDVADRRVSLRARSDGSSVIVSVENNGISLPDDQLSLIFEPFYTTKHDGMGLGLPICQAIVTAHGGTLTAERNPDRGMTFSFRLTGVGASLTV